MGISRQTMIWLIEAAGIGQLLLVAASLFIPRILGWKEETRKLRRLTRQVFWIYAGYIWFTNLSFGLLSALSPEWLLEGSGLALAVTGFIFTYWLIRLIIQFAWLDKSEILQKSRTPVGALYIAEKALDCLFIFLVLIYGLALTASIGKRYL